MKERIRHILKEETLKQSLIDEIKYNGVTSTAELVGGIDNLFDILNIEMPMDFLHLFDGLKQVRSEERPDWILFRYIPNYNFMIYNTKNEVVYINYEEIWGFLESKFGLKYQQIQDLTKEWLDEVYKLRGVTTIKTSWTQDIWLDEVYKLRGVTTVSTTNRRRNGVG